jgi:hypothetical protein
MEVPDCDCDLDWEHARANAFGDAFGAVTAHARFSISSG